MIGALYASAWTTGIQGGTLMRPYPSKARHGWIAAFKSVALGFCVFFLGVVLAAWLNSHNVHGSLAFLDNFVAGIAAGLVVLLYERWRQSEIDKKLRTNLLMNHHVRNALQVISAVASGDLTEKPARVQEAVRRIGWALREVLPGEIVVTEADAPPNPETSKKDSAA
jgi:hypothetical protein